jgi:hypothetical protein
VLGAANDASAAAEGSVAVRTLAEPAQATRTAFADRPPPPDRSGGARSIVESLIDETGLSRAEASGGSATPQSLYAEMQTILAAQR